MGEPRREVLARRLGELERELVQVQRELTVLGPGEALPGVYLLVETRGLTAAVPAAPIAEIVRIVAFSPLPQAPPHLLGTFDYRGEPALALDLGGLLAGARPLSLDCHMLVLHGQPRVAVVVDRVRSLVEALSAAEAGAELPQAWGGSRLVAGLCRAGGELLPLLDVERLRLSATEGAA